METRPPGKGVLGDPPARRRHEAIQPGPDQPTQVIEDLAAITLALGSVFDNQCEIRTKKADSASVTSVG